MPKLEGIHIKRTQKQHSSVVVVIPKLVRQALGIVAGDYIVFGSHPGTGVVEFSKFVPGVKKHGRDSADSDRKAGGG